MSTNQNQNNNNPQSEEEYVIDVSPRKFISWQNKMRTDTDELASVISSIFSKVFHDYVGCRVKCRKDVFNRDIFDTIFVFRDNPTPVPDGMVKATLDLVNVASQQNNSNYSSDKKLNYLTMMGTFNARSEGKTFTLTDEAKKVLLPYMGYINNQKPTLKNIENVINTTIESSINPLYGNGTEIISVIISGIDIYKLLKKIYGKEMVVSCIKGADGDYEANLSPCDYRIEFEKFKEGTNGQEAIITINQFSPRIGEEKLTKENSNLVYTDRLIFH